MFSPGYATGNINTLKFNSNEYMFFFCRGQIFGWTKFTVVNMGYILQMLNKTYIAKL